MLFWILLLLIGLVVGLVWGNVVYVFCVGLCDFCRVLFEYWKVV